MAPITERMFFDLIDNVVTHDILIEEVRSCETKHYLDDVKNLANREMLHIRVENFFHKLEEVSKSVGIYDLKSRWLYTAPYMMEALQAIQQCASIIEEVGLEEDLAFKIKNFDLNKLAFDGFESVLGKHPDQTSFTEFCAEFDLFLHNLDSVLKKLPREYIN